ncbi:hypothetical protein EPT53_07895 [Fusobacterium necrophorum]|uniref:Tetratricopeptide repeat protein n=1 Tax=Fusobacterium necrophorum TaxID=859 RepID=A0A4Q2KWT1_9FUSO|nr:hypothetical protein [Fusobacterium necrophorum]RXZ69040.1 hypothetical protein EPT53_07895 [Fusobacterium necrophorum]
MKRNIVYLTIYLFSFSHFLFSYSYEDYILYTKAKKQYQERKYQEAYESFSLLKRTFPYSRVQKSKLLDYYLGLTQYHLEQWEEAETLLTANILPSHIEERDYTLGTLHLKKNQLRQANLYFERLLSSEYSYSHELMEKKIEAVLCKINAYYKIYFAAKFYRNFEHISDLKRQDVLEIFTYLASKGERENAQRFLLEFLKRNQGKKEDFFPFYSALLTHFLKTKSYDKVLQYANLFSKLDLRAEENQDFYLLQKARAYHHRKEYVKAVSCYEAIQNPRYKSDAVLELAAIHYSLENYDTVIQLLEKKSPKSTRDLKLLGNSYFITKQREKFLSVAQKIEERESNAYENIMFHYFITNPAAAVDKDNSLAFTNFLVQHYLSDLYPFDDSNIVKSTSLEYEKLKDFLSIQDRDLVELEIKNSHFYYKTEIETTCAVNNFYESFALYDLAYQNAKRNASLFSRFRNSISLLFPRYYRELIQKYALQYGIAEDILNTLILLSSEWNSNYEKENKMGLFALDFRNTPEPSQLKNPEFSIEIACQKLKKIQEKYPGALAGMIVFLYGENYYKELIWEENGDISLNKISDLSMRYEIQQLILHYCFYKNLYS